MTTDIDTIKTAAREAVKETLEVLGLNVSTPEARQEIQKDFIHLRTLRMTGLAVMNKVLMVVVGALATSALWYVMHGAK